MSKWTKEATVETLVGFFMFTILVVLAVLTIIFSEDRLFRKTHKLEVHFENVGGLRKGDNVFMRGVKVGTVKDTLVNNGGVTVVSSLDLKPRLHTDYSVEVTPASVLGGKILTINEGSKDLPEIPEVQKIFGTAPVNLVDEAGLVIKKLHKALDDGKILKNLEETMANFNKISSDISGGKGTLGRLINDEELYDTLRELADNLHEVSGRLSEGKGTLGKLMSEDETFYNDLSATAASLRKISGKAANGEGTLGKFLADEKLYDEAESLVKEIRAAVDDMREAAPIRTFGSLMFGAF